jgi:hypothetical protein
MVEIGENKYECGLIADNEVKACSCLGECAILNRGTEEHGRNVTPPSNTELQYILFKIGRTWAILGDLGGPLGSTASQTKPGGSIPRQMAQFAKEMCLEM